MTTVTTPYGEFRLDRKDTVCISVAQCKRPISSRQGRHQAGDYVIVQHRKLPTHSLHIASGWGTYVATYSLDGTAIELPGLPDLQGLQARVARLETELRKIWLSFPVCFDEELHQELTEQSHARSN
jgi:hypothetical protein